MSVATHLVKVNGTFDPEKWTEEMLRDYVKKKIKVKETIGSVTSISSPEAIEDGIYIIFHPDLELFQIENNTINVWVFLTGYPSEITNKVVEKWLADNIKEDGLSVKSFEIKEIVKLWDIERTKNFCVITP